MTCEFTQQCVIPHRRSLVAFATKLARSKAAGEDIVQVALTKAWLDWQKRSPEDPVLDVKAWLYRIVSNCFGHWWDNQKLQRKVNNPHNWEVFTDFCHSQPPAAPVVGTWSDEVADALATLTPQYREVIEKRALEDIGLTEMSDEEMPANTVFTRSFRGYKKLRPQLAAYAAKEYGIGLVGPTSRRVSPKPVHPDTEAVENVMRDLDTGEQLPF